VHPLSHEELVKRVAEGAKYFPPPDFEIKSYSGELVWPQPVEPWQPPQGDDIWGTRMSTKGGMDVTIIAPRGLKVLPLRASVYYDMKINVVDDDNEKQSIFQHAITGIKDIKQSEEMQIPLPHPGRYTIEFRPTSGGGFWFQAVRGVPLTFGPFISEMGSPSPRLYFYVPKGLKTLAMYYPQGSAGGGAGLLRDGRDQPVKATVQDDGKLVTWPVAPGQDGQVWSLEGARSPDTLPRLLNAPNAFGFSPDTLLVPKDALE
jgi:hypothetical protein